MNHATFSAGSAIATNSTLPRRRDSRLRIMRTFPLIMSSHRAFIEPISRMHRVIDKHSSISAVVFEPLDESR